MRISRRVCVYTWKYTCMSCTLFPLSQSLYYSRTAHAYTHVITGTRAFAFPTTRTRHGVSVCLSNALYNRGRSRRTFPRGGRGPSVSLSLPSSRSSFFSPSRSLASSRTSLHTPSHFLPVVVRSCCRSLSLSSSRSRVRRADTSLRYGSTMARHPPG